ncbi:hypothetical protein ACS0TY_025908 [Phlomoides rotata]
MLVSVVSSYRYDKEVVDSSLANAEAAKLREAITAKKLDDDELLRILSTRNIFQLKQTFQHYKDNYVKENKQIHGVYPGTYKEKDKRCATPQGKTKPKDGLVPRNTGKTRHNNTGKTRQQTAPITKTEQLPTVKDWQPAQGATKNPEKINDKNKTEPPPNNYGTSIDKDILACGKSIVKSIMKVVIWCIDSPEKHFAEVVRAAIIGLGTDEDSLTRAIVARAEIDMMKVRGEYFTANKSSLDNAVIGDTSGDYKDFLMTLLGANV